MESNLLLEQYSRYKINSLESSPYRCLLNADIELNPHQINAFCSAVEALKTGGIVLADEVGLGKTIEAGLVLKYVLNSGAKRILIALPATLRKQWEIELDEKFNIKATILDRNTVNRDYDLRQRIEKSKDPFIAITSYDYASKLMSRFSKVKWDFCVIDEAHNLRNVFNGAKRARKLYEMTKGIPKILLTATPLQNKLEDLFGLISFIDPRIFGDEKVFNKRFVQGQNYAELKDELKPVLYRTLRKDVGKYMQFSKRTCHTVNFQLTPEEAALYAQVNDFLKRPVLYSIPTQNSSLITLVIRKLLASSSFAVAETFEVLKDRLEKLYEGTQSKDAQEGFDLFWDFVEDELEELDDDSIDEETIANKQAIQEELSLVDSIIKTAESISGNAKVKALKTAIKAAFDYQNEQGIDNKVVVFTESKRTQKYIANELRNASFDEEDILLFNGDFKDPMTETIYKTWKIKNYGNPDYGRSVEYKHAIVDYFKEHAKVLIVTDTGSEGLNLQFCNTVINYDLPWNPQKIEQRIGRCHRYGQKYDVVAINLLNTQNEADKRVYEILSKKFELFDGVFGASDVALGVLETGLSFEKMILEIYQNCNSPMEFKKAFDKLDRKIDSKKDKKASQLRSLLLINSTEEKGISLDQTKKDIDKYLQDVAYWGAFDSPEIGGNLCYWRVDDWGEKVIGAHGTLFLGAFTSNGEQLFPVLLLCDENGEYIDFDEHDLVSALEKIDDMNVKIFVPTEDENQQYHKIYDKLTAEMVIKYQQQTNEIKAYNKKKVENWVEIQKEQLNFRIHDMVVEINELKARERLANAFLEKVDIRKEIDEKLKRLEKYQESFHERISAIQDDGNKEIEEFNKQFDITPFLWVNIVLKF